MQYDQIPAPATCTVIEIADGHTSTVSVVVTGSGQDVAVAPGEIAEADVSDTYGLAAGQLEVTKTITGPLAGQQGQVVIHTVCDGTALVPDLVILAGATSDRLRSTRASRAGELRGHRDSDRRHKHGVRGCHWQPSDCDDCTRW